LVGFEHDWMQGSGSQLEEKANSCWVCSRRIADFAIIAIPVLLLLLAIDAARESARRVQCVNILRQIGIGRINDESAFRQFPPG
jgi:hypothetical protein